MSVLPPYRNQSIDLLSKSTDWFLHGGNTDIKWVKHNDGRRIFNKVEYCYQKEGIKKGIIVSLKIFINYKFIYMDNIWFFQINQQKRSNSHQT